MTLEQIQLDFIKARKEKDINKKEALEALISLIKTEEKATANILINDLTIIKCVQRALKELKEQLEYSREKDNLNSQIEILKNYLPKQLTEEEALNILKILYKVIPDNLNEKAKRGKLIGMAKQEMFGKYENIIELVDKYLK